VGGKRASSLIFVTTDFFNALEILLVKGKIAVLEVVLDCSFHLSEPFDCCLNVFEMKEMEADLNNHFG
jgi:hypothetical protein